MISSWITHCCRAGVKCCHYHSVFTSFAPLRKHTTEKWRTGSTNSFVSSSYTQRYLLVFFLPPGRKVLIVYAHQEPKSLNGSLKRVAVEELSKQGCSVTVSDLYAMQFEPRATRNDIVGETTQTRLFFNNNETNFHLVYPAALTIQNKLGALQKIVAMILYKYPPTNKTQLFILY